MIVSKAISINRSTIPVVVIICFKVPRLRITVFHRIIQYYIFLIYLGEKDLVRLGTEDKPDGH